LFHSLENVVAVYNTGIPTGKPKGKQREDAHFPRQSELIKPLGLSDRDLTDLVALLRALDEPTRRVVPPKLPDFPPGE
jgi:cytochrome c peroxidase